MGSQRTQFEVRSDQVGLHFPGYHNNGYKQSVQPQPGGFHVQVETRNAAIASRLRGRAVRDLPPALKPLETVVNRHKDTYLADQITFLFAWLQQEITLETEYVADQSLAKIMRTRSANCVGLANIAIEVLDAMGVKARYVTGIAFQRNDRAVLRLEGSVLHRWIEIHYDDVGWVFADPSGKVNFVEATYLLMGIDTLHPLETTKQLAVGSYVELLKLENGFRVAGRMPGLDSRLRIRPNRLSARP
nr:transglutaminase domain-containing protein [Acanthopleuribacter pedis]